MSMQGMSMGAAASPHKPTLGWTVGIIVVVVILYHVTLGKK
jgi:hypothetical protein